MLTLYSPQEHEIPTDRRCGIFVVAAAEEWVRRMLWVSHCINFPPPGRFFLFVPWVFFRLTRMARANDGYLTRCSVPPPACTAALLLVTPYSVIAQPTLRSSLFPFLLLPFVAHPFYDFSLSSAALRTPYLHTPPYRQESLQVQYARSLCTATSLVSEFIQELD
jgi:hypothetical protein